MFRLWKSHFQVTPGVSLKYWCLDVYFNNCNWNQLELVKLCIVFRTFLNYLHIIVAKSTLTFTYSINQIIGKIKLRSVHSISIAFITSKFLEHVIKVNLWIFTLSITEPVTVLMTEEVFIRFVFVVFVSDLDLQACCVFDLWSVLIRWINNKTKKTW